MRKCTSKGHILVRFEFDGHVSAELYQKAKNCIQIVVLKISLFIARIVHVELAVCKSGKAPSVLKGIYRF